MTRSKLAGRSSSIFFCLTAAWFVFGLLAYGKLFGVTDIGGLVGFAPMEWGLVFDLLAVIAIYYYAGGD